MRAYLLCGMALALIGSTASAQSADTTCSRSLLGVNCRTQYHPAAPTYNIWDGLRDFGNAMQRDREIKAMEQQAAEIAALRADLAAQRAREQAQLQAEIHAEQAATEQAKAQILASADYAVQAAEQDGRCEDAAKLAQVFGTSILSAPGLCGAGRRKAYRTVEDRHMFLASRTLLYWGLSAYSGQNEAQDHGLAASYFRLAANQGSARGQYYLGLMYRKGEGVARNNVEAWRLIRLSAAQGYPAAKEALALAPKAAPKGKKLAARAR